MRKGTEFCIVNFEFLVIVGQLGEVLLAVENEWSLYVGSKLKSYLWKFSTYKCLSMFTKFKL